MFLLLKPDDLGLTIQRYVRLRKAILNKKLVQHSLKSADSLETVSGQLTMLSTTITGRTKRGMRDYAIFTEKCQSELN